jgi:Tfp pilus assembly protein PilF
MKLRVPGNRSIFRRRSVIVLLVLILLIGCGGYFYNKHINDKNKNKQVDPSPTRSATIQPEIEQADTSLKNKDYNMAADYYLSAASDALASGRPKQAESILRQAISRIPPENMPWYIYSALAQVARQLGDNNLEKQSLQKAIDKSSVAGSDISPAQLKIIKDRLAAIN